jgi:NAD(P)-dependent dehydrogenase (short-subunit alcohol dehydrogenase family)
MSDSSYPDLCGTTAVVTGGAKGIGESCVRALVHEGVRVAIFDLDAEAGEKLAGSLAGGAHVYTVDVSNSAQVSEAFAQVAGDLGPPTLLVNNAGICVYGTVTETSEQEWDRVIGVNLKSQFLCAKEVVPHMEATGHGAIVNVASVQSFMSQARVAAYSASKTGILGLTRAIAVDHAPRIRCNAVCPGTVDTPMLADAIKESPDPQAVLQECHDMHLTGRIAKPEEIANLVLFLLSDKAAFVTGQAYRIDGGLGVEIAGSKRDE